PLESPPRILAPRGAGRFLALAPRPVRPHEAQVPSVRFKRAQLHTAQRVHLRVVPAIAIHVVEYRADAKSGTRGWRKNSLEIVPAFHPVAQCAVAAVVVPVAGI